MDCKQFREILDLYVDQELSAGATAAAGAHVAECSHCRQAVTQLQLLRRCVKESVNQHEVPQTLDRGIREQIRPSRVKQLVPVLAACLVLFFVIVAMASPRSRCHLANRLENLAALIDKPGPIVLEGKILCRDDELHARYGVRAMCSVRGHHGALETSDGKIWNLIENESSQELIHDSAFLGKHVRIRGKMYREAGSLDVDSYELL